jgi:hypothetical protein
MKKPFLKEKSLLEQRSYNPDNLLDQLILQLELDNDAGLARALGVSPPIISRVRHRRNAISAALLLRMHDVSHLTIIELRKLMGVAIIGRRDQK